MSNAFDDIQPDAPTQIVSAPKSTGNAFDDITPPISASSTASAPPPSFGQQLGRGAGLTARAAAQGIAGLPLMGEDFVHALYKLGTDPQARSATWEQMKHPSQWLTPPSDAPSQKFSHALDPYLPTPKTIPEKLASFGVGASSGLLMPQIQWPGAKAPEGFVSPKDAQTARTADSLQDYKDAGLVVPPSTTNPTMGNKFLETISGKEATQNTAREMNQSARNALAADDLGLKPEMMTPGAVEALKKEAGQAWETARQIPMVKTDDQYLNDLAEVTKQSAGANASFPGAKNPDIEKLIDTYTQPQFTGDAGVSAMNMLRQKATDAYRQGDAELGKAYKGISMAIDKQLERGAAQTGNANVVQTLRASRPLYAKASDVLDMMDPAGNISGQKLAAAWERDEPLSGGLLTAAEHAKSFPKANLPANSSNISHLNALTAPLAAMEGYHLGGWKGAVAGGALPFARGGARSYLLSGMGQSGAIPQAGNSYREMLAAALRNPAVLAGGANQ
jgi:hypothetical protein